MNGGFVTFLVADVVGAITLWMLTRARTAYPWAWSIGAWVTVAGVGTGLIPLGTIVPLAAMTMVLGVGLIAPLVGLIAAIMIAVSPFLIGQQVWGWWRRRRGVVTRISRA
jgi:hypothetical protein